ncbi:hypothetical protein BBJ28_00017870 [Nothophytophthora sp. Chile5]|nr:hypothetical protein BBJ28_00017870 [Nothophytophthora sp. Chile5]
MRNFPVQDFIPVEGDGAPVVVDNQATDSDMPEPEVTSDSSSPQLAPIDSEGAQDLTEECKHSLARPVCASHHATLPETESTLESGGISALLSSVLTLPTFEGDSFLKKKPKKAQVPGKSKPRRQSQTNGGSSQPFHQSEEFSVSYPNSTVTAVQVRCDGSAIARWPTGSVAVSVDPDAGGFRVYAAHKDGQLALSFDAAGVGFLNDYPSGKTLISTTSSGDGLLFDVSSGGILRQWDSQGRLRDGACQTIDSLGDESDGSLLCRFNEHLAVRIQLTQQQTEQSEDLAFSQKAPPSSPLLVHIYFAAPPSIRHVFVNRANLADAADGDCCDYALGKDFGAVAKSRAVKTKPPPVQHLDLLDSIRAAVAGL